MTIIKNFWPKKWQLLQNSLGLLFLCALTMGHVKLNVPRVRLPFSDSISINFTLIVDTPGCYKWTISRPDIIMLTTVDGREFDEENSCSEAAVISTVPRSPCCPINAVVYAQDLNTQEIVRCDIIVDKITSIQIVTTTKELHLEAAPSKFTILGYGGKGNVFSTLEGVPFRWWLESTHSETSSVTDPQSIMRFIPFSESSYDIPEAISVLESQRLQGSQVLVEGLKTGSAKIFARLSDPIYKSIAPAEVKIVVVANLIVEPHEVYTVMDTVLPMKLMQLRHGRLVELSLTSGTYTVEVSNPEIVSYNPKKSLITTLKLGDAKIVVKDKNNVEEIEDGQTESLTSYIYVREPKFLSLTIKPFKNWALMTGQEYEIEVEMYDSENFKLFIGDNVFIKTTFDSHFFRKDFSSANGSYHIGTPVRTGTAKVVAELDYIQKLDGTKFRPSPAPRVQVEMEIFQRVAVNPKQVVIPWDSNLRPRHEITYKASGGNGNFIWTTTNSSVITVSQAGQSRTESFGYANITAAMTINSNIKGSGKVYVLQPSKMAILDHIVEAEIGTAILVPVAFYTILPDDPTLTPVPFTTCRNLPFQIDIEDPSFYRDTKNVYPHAKPACVYIPIISDKLGSSLVTVTYATGDQVFRDSVTVSTFKHLKVVEPAQGTTVLAVGSSRQLVFEGGPRPLLERAADFSKTISIQNQTVVKTFEIKTQSTRDDLYVYEVVCKEIGETLVTLHTGNMRIAEDRRPVSRTADINVICGEPAKVFFKIETVISQDDDPRCPHDVSAAQIVRVPVPNYEKIPVSVTVKDPQGRKFDNISSLTIQWTAKELPFTLDFQHQKFIQTEKIQVNGYNVPGKSFQYILPSYKSGNVEVTAEVTGYRAEVLKQYEIRHNMRLANLDPSIEYLYQRSLSMDLQLVSDPVLEASTTTMFNHPSSQSQIKILEGTGHFFITTQPENMLKLVYFDNNKTLTVSPFSEGNVKVTVKDLCLPRRPITTLDMKINGVGTIEVDVVDKIQVSDDVIATVILFDKNGNKLTSKDLALIKLKPINPTSDLIQVEPIHSQDDLLGSGSIQYKIRGKSVGTATLSFSAEGPGRISKSAPKKITVFPPLSVSPENLTLLVGSVYQIVAHGGPIPDTLIQYSTREGPKNLERVTLTQNGIIRGSQVGSTTVEARSIDRSSPSTIYSQATVRVKVVNLIGIRINSPLTRILVNHDLPLWAFGIGDGGVQIEPDLLLGGKTPLMNFHWSVINKNAGEIKHPLETCGLKTLSHDQISTRFRALQQGRATIKLVANYSGFIFQDEMDIEVVEDLQLTKYPILHSNFLMTPNSEGFLFTTKDSSPSVVVSYDVIEGDQEIVSVDNAGKISSFNRFGTAIVSITAKEKSGLLHIITLTVQVKRCSFILLNPSIPVSFFQSHRKVPITALPQGLNFPIDVTAHDDLGRKFHVTNLNLNNRPNRYDVAILNQGGAGADNQNQNQSLKISVQNVNEGRVGLKVLDDGNSLYDFLAVSLSEAIEPKTALKGISVGDIICFTSSVRSKDGQPGIWNAAPSGILEISSESGTAVALGPGRVRVHYTIPGYGFLTSSDVEVKSIQSVSLISDRVPEYISNGDEQLVLEIPAKLGDKLDNSFGFCSATKIFNDLTGIRSPFKCNLQFEDDKVQMKATDLFSVEPVFKPANEWYVCQIRPKGIPTRQFYGSSIDSDLRLSVTMESYTDGNNNNEVLRTPTTREQLALSSEPLTIRYLPAPFVHTTHLQLDNGLTGSIYITGLPKVLNQLKFITSDPRSIEIDPYKYEIGNPFTLRLVTVNQAQETDKLPQSAETRIYKVELVSSSFQNLNISVISHSPKQTVQIPITVNLAGFKFSAEKSFFMGLITSVTFYLVSFITIFLGWIVFKYTDAKGYPTTTSEAVFITTPTHPNTSFSPFSSSLRSPSSSGGSFGDSVFDRGDFASPGMRKIFSNNDGPSGDSGYRFSASGSSGSPGSGGFGR